MLFSHSVSSASNKRVWPGGRRAGPTVCPMCRESSKSVSAPPILAKIFYPNRLDHDLGAQNLRAGLASHTPGGWRRIGGRRSQADYRLERKYPVLRPKVSLLKGLSLIKSIHFR